MQQLLAQGANIKATLENSGGTAFHLAVFGNQIGAVQFLLSTKII